MNVIKGTLALTGKSVWIWVDKIISMRGNIQEGTVIVTTDGQTIVLKQKPDEVIETIQALLK
jgi:uncharacterized protein YlzI (FlbEa/FlbD family)